MSLADSSASPGVAAVPAEAAASLASAGAGFGSDCFATSSSSSTRTTPSAVMIWNPYSPLAGPRTELGTAAMSAASM